jgi:hypothetical protein
MWIMFAGLVNRLLILACGVPFLSCAADYYVAPAGNDAAIGSIKEPFQSIQKGISILKSGDRLILRTGRYHEHVVVKDLKGDEAQPITICAYDGEKVVLDGTEPVASLADGKWELYKDGIYSLKLKRDIWQLIADGELQTTARWPNAFWYDDSIFDLNHWAMGNADDEWYDYPKRGLTGHCGVMGNTPDEKFGINLKKLSFDLTGAVAILNVANYDTYSYPVIKHDMQKGIFTFQIPEKNGVFHRPMYKKTKEDPVGRLEYRFHKYFFEGKLEFLDAPGEWYYDKTAQTLYFYPLHGKSPDGMDIRGKVQTYALEVAGCEHLTLRGLQFFGTTIKCIRNRHITIEDNEFIFPSYSKRVLGDWMPVETTVFFQAEQKGGDFKDHNFDPSYLTLRNCTFTGADGDAVKLQGLGNVIDNCYFHKIDYSCVDESTDPDIPQLPGNGGTVHTWWSPGVLVRRCTIDLAGEGHNFMGGMYSKKHQTNNIIEYCRTMRCGRLHAQDGANFHIWQFDCDYMMMRYNWAQDTFKYPFRLDGIYHVPEDKKAYLDHCLSYRLVAFNSVIPDYSDPINGLRSEGNIGIAIKGEFHRTYHTLSFNNNTVGLFVRNEGGGGNMHSDTRNNASMCISGKRNGEMSELGNINGVCRANWSGAAENLDIKELLRDADNMDFRPRKGSPLIDKGEKIEGINDHFVGAAPDIGAYEFGDEEYWIPGYQTQQASTPIPPNGTMTAKSNCDLMWLGGYRAVSHQLHFGISAESLDADSKGDSSHIFELKGTSNIVAPGLLTPGCTYYWRVDAIDAAGRKTRGSVWSFTVQK